MTKAILGKEKGIPLVCCICGKMIENEMYESFKPRGSYIRYFHKKCYTIEKKANIKK